MMHGQNHIKIWGIHNHAVEDLILPGCDATSMLLGL